MRILHVTRDLPPATKGGISTAVAGLARALAADGVDTCVLSLDGWRPTKRAQGDHPLSGPDDVSGLAVWRATDAEQGHAITALVTNLQPSVVHVHDALAWDVVAPALRGLRTIYSVHVLHAMQNQLRGVERTMSGMAEARALALADVVVCPSRAVAAHVDAARAVVIPNGVTVPALAADPAGDRAPNILYAGRFDDIKGTAELFEALLIALGARPDATATIAGGVPGNPRAERRWRAQWDAAAPTSVATRVKLLGWCAPPALEAAFARASVQLVPSRWETFGLAAAEGMAHGLPIVATRAGGLPDVVGDAGLLVPPQDAKALADAVIALLNDPARRARLGRAARERVMTHYSWPHVLPRWVSLYSGGKAGRP